VKRQFPQAAWGLPVHSVFLVIFTGVNIRSLGDHNSHVTNVLSAAKTRCGNATVWLVVVKPALHQTNDRLINTITTTLNTRNRALADTITTGWDVILIRIILRLCIHAPHS
jgi:glycerol-3-phosphate acyltransferase PlsY